MVGLHPRNQSWSSLWSHAKHDLNMMIQNLERGFIDQGEVRQDNNTTCSNEEAHEYWGVTTSIDQSDISMVLSHYSLPWQNMVLSYWLFKFAQKWQGIPSHKWRYSYPLVTNCSQVFGHDSWCKPHCLCNTAHLSNHRHNVVEFVNSRTDSLQSEEQNSALVKITSLIFSRKNFKYSAYNSSSSRSYCHWRSHRT